MKSGGTNNIKKWLGRALWIVPFVYVFNFVYAIYSKQSGGTFGDTFGAANALFSGFALLMLVLAVILQRDELNLVKDERNQTRKILDEQRILNDAQKSALNRQFILLFSCAHHSRESSVASREHGRTCGNSERFL